MFLARQVLFKQIGQLVHIYSYARSDNIFTTEKYESVIMTNEYFADTVHI